MNRTPVKSSNITSIGFDSSSDTLEIEFSSGAVYQYPNVPPELYAQMQEAKSVGGFFSASIRGKFEGKKVPPPEKAAS